MGAILLKQELCLRHLHRLQVAPEPDVHRLHPTLDVFGGTHGQGGVEARVRAGQRRLQHAGQQFDSLRERLTCSKFIHHFSP